MAFGMTILRGDVVFRTHTFNLTYGGNTQTCQWRALYEIVGRFEKLYLSESLWILADKSNNGAVLHR